jgi:two-component system, OmpR family, sensor kinase
MVDAGVPAPPGRTGKRPFAAFRRLSDRTPLRTKLITAVLVLVVMALAAISIASLYMLRSYLTTQHDSELQASLNLITETKTLPPNTSFGSASPTNSELVVGIQQPGTQLSWIPSRNPLGGASQDPLPQLPTSANWAPTNSSVTMNVPAQSGPSTWRIVAQSETFTLPDGSNANGTLVVGVDLGDINAVTHRLVLFDLIVGGAIVIILAAVGAAAIQANLRPLNDIELTAGQIARGHLNHRITELDPRTEIGSLGHSLNAMLTQIESAFHAQEESEQAAHESEERMRRFIADASHELRTPLTTIRGFAEYYRQRGGVQQDQDLSSGTERDFAVPVNGHSPEDLPEQRLTPQDLDRIMHRLEAEASRMGLLVEDLLQLARIDQQRPLDLAPVDLLALAADAVQDARMVAPDRPIDLAVAPGAAFIVEGDEPRLRQVIGNLVNNALTHTPAGTPVRVLIGSGTLVPPPADGPGRGNGAGGARALPGRRPTARPVPAVLLDVEDDGPGMTTEQAQHVFERFYRADQARNRASGGTGLGLAIVAGLVAAHGGTVSLRTAPGEGADFQVRLPLSPDAQDDAEPAEPDDDEPAEPDDDEPAGPDDDEPAGPDDDEPAEPDDDEPAEPDDQDSEASTR